MKPYADQLHGTVSINNTICSIDQLSAVVADAVIYEVIRVIDGIALFLEDHIERFHASAKILSLPADVYSIDIKKAVYSYIKHCDIKLGNLKFAYFHSTSSPPTFLLYATKFSYPQAELYATGIKTDLLYAERDHPNAKDEQPIRVVANAFIADRKLYEAILVSPDGGITEGSKSNLFFQKGSSFITAPASAVLKGITRKYVMQAIADCGLHLVERTLFVEELSETTGAFISGTSPKILPIAEIGTLCYKVPTKEMLLLMARYECILKDYIFVAKSQTK